MLHKIGIRFVEEYGSGDPKDVLLGKFTDRKKDAGIQVMIQVANESVFIQLSKEIHRWWSPELVVRIEEKDNGSMIKEVIGPDSGTFTLTMFVLTGSLTIFTFALLVVFSQISLSQSPAISLVITGASVLIGVGALVTMAWARRKAKTQIQILRNFVRETLY